MTDIREIDGVNETLRRYRDATFTNDVEMMKSIFHPKATLSGLIISPTAPSGALMFESMDILYGMMKDQASPRDRGEAYEMRVGAVTVDGAMATAVVYEENLEDSTFVNHMQLHKTDGRWIITSKAFHSV